MDRTSFDLTPAAIEAIAQRVAQLLKSPATTAIDPDAIYTVPQAAPLVKMHPDTLREKLRVGVITGRRKGGGAYRILGAELLKLAVR